MLLFRVLWACKGAGGFIGQLREACRGVVGFKVAMWLRHVREKVRPARPGVGASAKKFALQAQNGRKRCFQARWANFFAEMPLEALCWATFVAVVLVVLAVGLRYPRREPHSVTRPWHCGVRAVDNEARASCR